MIEGGDFMALKLFKKDTEPQCALCEYGQLASGGESVICRKVGGVMQPFSKCRKYKYDPLKREPKIITFSGVFLNEDFEL